jgi:ferrous iron transport protein B
LKRIALLGMPNTGKSTFFNRFTGAHASIGNWPGITVDLMAAKVQVGTEMAEVVDLPGIYDLRGFSADERVVCQFLAETPLNLVLIILNSAQLDRQLSLALQIKHLQIPAVLLLNMADEAPKFGVSVDTVNLSKRLGIPVVPLSAKYGDGYELAVSTIAQMLKQHPVARQVSDFKDRVVTDRQMAAELGVLLQETIEVKDPTNANLTTRIDRVLLHPVFGLPIFFGTMFLMFQFVYAIGTPIQKILGNLFDWFKAVALEPILAGFHPFLKSFLIDGLYQGIATVTAFIPVIILFFFCMAIIEDSGYLSRSAFLMDALMERLGLDGRSFVMSLMGFGCNVPAIMGTRVMRSPGLRLLSMMVIPFSLCSARLNVFIFMTTALFAPYVAPLVLFSLYLFSFAAMILTAILFKGKFASKEPFVLELPPYRFPTFKQIWLRSWREVKHFMFWSRRFIIFGVIVIWFLNNFPNNVPSASAQTLSGMIGTATQPFLHPIGIDSHLAIALIFGFVAKEIVLGGLAVIYQAQGDGLSHAIAAQIDWVQAYSFMLFTLLYTPCLSTVAVLKSESKSWKFTLTSVVWSIGLAWIASFIFYQSARGLGW